MFEVVALMEVPDGEHILNLQIVGSSQGNVFGEEENTPYTVISAKNSPYHYTLRVFHHIDSGCRVISSLQMSNAGNHCRTGTPSSSLVKLGGASYMHSVMVDAGQSGAMLHCPDRYVL